MADFLERPQVAEAIIDAATWLRTPWAQGFNPALVDFAPTVLEATTPLFRAECVRVTDVTIRSVMREHPAFFARSRELADTYRRRPDGYLASGMMVHARPRREQHIIAVHALRVTKVLMGCEAGPDGRVQPLPALQPTPDLLGVDAGRPDQWLSRWIVPEIARRAAELPEVWIATADRTEVTVPAPFVDLTMRLERLGQEHLR